MATACEGVAPVLPSHAKLQEPPPDWCLAPDGRKVEDVPPVEFRRLVAATGIEVDLSLGHSKLVEAYAKHVQGIYDRAGRDAVTAWLATKGVLA